MDKLTFVVLYIVVMLFFGLTATIFYPDQYNFKEPVDVSTMHPPHEKEQGFWDKVVSFFQGIADAFVGLATFLWACLSFNIPQVPAVIRALLVVPFHAGMAYVIATYVRGGG